MVARVTTMRVIIIGGGLAGLTAAYDLTRSGYETMVLEKDSVPGGMLASYNINGYSIEKYYHHLFESDGELRALIDELGLGDRLAWLRATTGYYTRGKVFSLDTPIQILKFPDLTFRDTLRLARFVMQSKRIEDPMPFDEVTARKWILESANHSIFDNFFVPLLKSKFGENMDRVSAAWLLSRINLRSNRGARGEKLGYIRGGFENLINAVQRVVTDRGGVIRCNARVDRVTIEGGEVIGVEIEGSFIPSDAVISTIPPAMVLPKHGGVSKTSQHGSGTSIRYQGSVCLLIGLEERLMKDTYWLNIKPDAHFGAVIEHTNLLPPKNYGGDHLVYLTTYIHDASASLMTAREEEVAELYINTLGKLFPAFNKDRVLWWKLARDMCTAPIYETGYRKKILPYKAPIKNLYLAGIFSHPNYPERSMNGSIKAGLACARELVREVDERRTL